MRPCALLFQAFDSGITQQGVYRAMAPVRMLPLPTFFIDLLMFHSIADPLCFFPFIALPVRRPEACRSFSVNHISRGNVRMRTNASVRACVSQREDAFLFPPEQKLLSASIQLCPEGLK
ncbi:hypothetical protein NDU88_001765 [Pleurodeles waltl]|uniref:Uncharacterized protein n=1 Tax=Pleurodeles waltl TaxID=8319 RepID=A0AAV7P852_PLEWA|nr:hypothetical protein NDU88_001765 [Pleurodeles waltl]